MSFFARAGFLLGPGAVSFGLGVGLGASVPEEDKITPISASIDVRAQAEATLSFSNNAAMLVAPYGTNASVVGSPVEASAGPTDEQPGATITQKNVGATIRRI